MKNKVNQKMIEAYVSAKSYISSATTADNKGDVAAEDKKIPTSVKMFYAIVAAMCAIMMVAAFSGYAHASVFSGIGNVFKTMFKDVYNTVRSVATVGACAVVAICQLTRMFSKNPKNAEAATEWQKRAMIAWLVIMCLSILVEIGASIFKESGATSSPWEKAPD